MRLIRDARTLQQKALASLRTAMTAFNSYDDDGRVTTVLLHLQHACEMLLKAALVQNKIKVFDRDSGKSIGFERCLRLCEANHGLTAGEAGVMRSVDSLRDASQHWFVFVAEDLLYMQTRALITCFDAYLKRALGTDLRSEIPPRVLPVSTKPPGDFGFLVDREYKLIGELLQPGKRHRDEARARIRSLLALEAIVTEGVEISEHDVDRIEKAIRAGEELGKAFPRLITVTSTSDGEGVDLKIHFSKKEGAPVRYIGGDDPGEAAAVREVDLQKKFHLSASKLARALRLSEPRAKALRGQLAVDEDQACAHQFKFGKTKFLQFSDNARNKMREALDAGIDMDAVWAEHRPRPKRR